MPSMFFFTIPNVIGSSQDEAHPQAMELLSYSNSDGYQVSHHEITGKAVRSDQVHHGNFTISKLFDLASNSLRRSLWQGEILDEAKLEIVRGGQPFLTIEFKKVLLQDISINMNLSCFPMEMISFTYGEVKHTYHVYNSDGTKRGETTAKANVMNPKEDAFAESEALGGPTPVLISFAGQVPGGPSYSGGSSGPSSSGSPSGPSSSGGSGSPSGPSSSGSPSGPSSSGGSGGSGSSGASDSSKGPSSSKGSEENASYSNPGSANYGRLKPKDLFRQQQEKREQQEEKREQQKQEEERKNQVLCATLKNQATQEPLANVEVKISNADSPKQVTNRKGYFCFKNTEMGEYELEILGKNYSLGTEPEPSQEIELLVEVSDFHIQFPLLNLFDEPYKNTPYQVEVDGDLFLENQQTDKQGKVDFKIPCTAQELVLQLGNSEEEEEWEQLRFVPEDFTELSPSIRTQKLLQTQGLYEGRVDGDLQEKSTQALLHFQALQSPDQKLSQKQEGEGPPEDVLQALEQDYPDELLD